MSFESNNYALETDGWKTVTITEQKTTRQCSTCALHQKQKPQHNGNLCTATTSSAVSTSMTRSPIGSMCDSGLVEPERIQSETNNNDDNNDEQKLLRTLPCDHVFCLRCLRLHHAARQQFSTIRIASLPCPVCRGFFDFSSILATPGDSAVSCSERKETQHTSVVKPEHSIVKAEKIEDVDGMVLVEYSERLVESTEGGEKNEEEDLNEYTTGHVDSPLTGRKQVRFIFPECNCPTTEQNACKYITPIVKADCNNNYPVRGETGNSIDVDDFDLKAHGHAQRMSTNSEYSDPLQRCDGAEGQTASRRWQIIMRDRELPTSVAITSSVVRRETLNRSRDAVKNQSRDACAVIVAEYGKSRLRFLDITTGETQRIAMGMKPFSVTVDWLPISSSAEESKPLQRILVGDRRLKTLVIFDGVNGIDSPGRLWAPSGCFPWVAGVGVLRNGNLVVCDRELAKIGVYSSSGAERLSEFGSYGQTDSQLCMAEHIAVSSLDHVIVSDAANHIVKVFDVGGHLVTQLGQGRGPADGQLCWPRGVSVVNNGCEYSILVADSMNNRISMFSCSGQFIRHVLVGDPTWRPYAINYDVSSSLLAVIAHTSRASGHSVCELYDMPYSLINKNE